MHTFQSLSSLYRLLYILSILQISASLLTTLSFVGQFSEIGLSQFLLIFSAVCAIPMTRALHSAIRRPEGTLCSVIKHIQYLYCFTSVGFMIAFLVLGNLAVPKKPPSIAFPGCFRERFMRPKCALLVFDLSIPWAFAMIALIAKRRIKSRARAIHGDRMVARPVLVPAWEMEAIERINELKPSYKE
ncbi:hypothetical protein MVEN_00184500 [Mycena venus]|uniref:Uncharacterized protein n=1 Tax=Mycena venus TaxID=2733690 RepID=A0A8H7DEI4_9AGAR|nr:hypothetical protein MVEN_00184500 [Mycena venus]